MIGLLQQLKFRKSSLLWSQQWPSEIDRPFAVTLLAADGLVAFVLYFQRINRVVEQPAAGSRYIRGYWRNGMGGRHEDARVYFGGWPFGSE
jgi:hypothetical protein